MKLLLATAFASILILASCVPIPETTTYQLYLAQGAGAKVTGQCNNTSTSKFQFTIGPKQSHNVGVSLRWFDGRLEALVTAFADEVTDVQVSPERLRLVYEGRELAPVSTKELVNHYSSFLGKSYRSSARFNIGSAPIEKVELIVRPGGVLIDGKDKPLPAMRFAYVSRTDSRLTQPINC